MKKRAARATAYCICAGLVLFLALTTRFYWEYKAFDLTGYPKRLTVKGRHFEVLGTPVSESHADAVKDDPSKPLRRVGAVHAIPGLSWHEREVSSRFDEGCPTSVYLRVGPDRYISYTLLGGC